MSEQGQGRSWWTTLPGILTGVAALLTAVTGLVVALLPIFVAQRDAPSTRGAQQSPSSPSQLAPPGAGRQGNTNEARGERQQADSQPDTAAASNTSAGGTNRQSGAAPLVYGEPLNVAGTQFEVLNIESASPRTGMREIRVTFQVTAGEVDLWLARSNVRLMASGRVYTPVEGLPATALRAGVRRQFWVRFEIEEPLFNPILSFTDDMHAPRGEVRRGLARL
jgi:hypothetical protein